MKGSVLLAVALLALTTLANPTPYRGDPRGTFPPNPRATLTYANGGGTVELAVDGDYLSVIKECRGLDGTHAVTFVDVLTRDPVSGGRAYSVLLFPEWGCKGIGPKGPTQVKHFFNNGEPLKDEDGNVVIPKSYKLVP